MGTCYDTSHNFIIGRYQESYIFITPEKIFWLSISKFDSMTGALLKVANFLKRNAGRS
jgi:hypothetical protein